ncbi:MAG: hypothetical protein DWI25_07090 [Planctomycetota bacterium]|nr:MAG: hypothetical protein DWI25_07090 [Planctomycetota bacterium]
MATPAGGKSRQYTQNKSSHRPGQKAPPAPSVTSRSNREQTHNVLHARRVAGKSGTSPKRQTGDQPQ